MLKILKLYKKTFVVIVLILFFIFIMSCGKNYDKSELEYGITFSSKQAKNLELDWEKAYLDILTELNINKIRIPAYWDLIEKEKDSYNWDEIDFLVKNASERGVEIILAIGGRLPRWPECHFPAWYKELPDSSKEEKLLNYIEKTINRYKDYENISAWQIENEPFLPFFGECPKLDKDLLDKEIALAKNIDDRPIVITDSGELSLWVPAARRADIFGTTMYRDTYSKALNSYVHYPIESSFFKFKKNIVRLFSFPKKWIVIELQGEPWGPKQYQDLTKEEKAKTMDKEKFKEMIEFSSKTGFKEFYLWGVEWWYWERERGNTEMWDEALRLFNNPSNY
jgi:hypothetical protein